MIVLGTSRTTPAPELITIDRGALYLVRPESIKGSRECIFIDASISIRRITLEYHYQLVVTRACDEGEEELLDEDAENSDERAFLLDSSLFLSLGPTLDPAEADSVTKPLSFTWLDPDGDSPDDEFEFVLSQPPQTVIDTATTFERLTWRCMWERAEGRSFPTDKAEAKLIEDSLRDEFQVERAVPVTRQQPRLPLFRAESEEYEEEDEQADEEEEISQEEEEEEEQVVQEEDDDSGDELAAALLSKAVISAPSAQQDSPARSDPVPSTSGSPIASTSAAKSGPPAHLDPLEETSAVLFCVKGGLHLFDRATGMFMLQDGDVEIAIHQTQQGYWLLVQGQGGTWVSQGIDKEMVINFSEKDLAMTFNFSYEPPRASPSDEVVHQVFTWLIRCDDSTSFETVQAGVATALFEDKWGGGTWKKLKPDERDYQKSAYLEEDVAMDDAREAEAEAEDREEEELESEEEESEPNREEERDSEDDDGSDGSDAEAEPRAFNGPGAKAKNSQLAVGYKNDLSFVVQGDMIGVFKQQRDGGKKLKFVTSIVGIATPDGKKGFVPSKVMLHNQDTSMILQNPLAPGSLYRLDLETGKVVDEYKVSDDFSVSNFIPDSKFAQTTQQQTFIGLSSNGVFRVDPRLNGNKLVGSEFKQYATKNDFSVAATTESGRLAVASNKGDIRLFDALGKNAKTALPALGDPIIGIDVSADGRWIIATCKTYLLLIDTLIPEGAGRYGGSSGFDRSFPAAQKPTPRRLQLKPEHVAYMQQNAKEGVSFTPAKFNSGPNELEKTIITSTGPFVVAWNFRRVKSGDVNNYTLRRFSDTIIADNFKFGGDREIIVTLPGNVFVEEKKKLKAPTRDSMSIVKQWDDRD